MDEVAEEDEIGKFYSHDNGADLVQEEGSTQPIRFPDQVNSTRYRSAESQCTYKDRLKGVQRQGQAEQL